MSKLKMTSLKNVEQPIFILIFGGFCISFLLSCAPTKESKKVSEIEQLVWTNPDSCMNMLRSFGGTDTICHSSTIQQLCFEHAFLRVNHQLHCESVVDSLANIFSEHKDYIHAGTAFYMLGTNYFVQNDAFTATFYLKQAEHHLLQCKDIPVNLLGIVYYRIGNSFNAERLLSLSNSYFKLAIDYLSQSSNYYYLSSAYRDYALSLPDSCHNARSQYLDSALLYAQKSDIEWIEQDIECAILEYVIDSCSTDKIDYYHILCDSLGITNVAGDLAQYYLQQGNMPKTEHYLQLLALDTCNSYWSREHYEYLYASYLNARGDKDSAILYLQRLHIWQTKKIEKTAFIRTFLIAQQLDVAHEREIILEQKIEKQHLQIALALSFIILMCLCIGGIILYYKAQMRMTKQKETISLLKIQHEHAQQLLQGQLHERLSQAKKLEEMLLKHKKIEIPDWTRNYYEALLLNTPEQITKFHEAFNHAYDHLLSHLKEKCPDLTTTDLTLIGLISMNLSHDDCYLLLNLTKESYYNRRQRLKKHLGLSADTNLDEWIREYQKKGML